MIEQSVTFLLTQGVLGVSSIILGVVVRILYNKSERLQAKIDELHEARRLDAKETTAQVTSVLPGISQSLEHISDKIEISKTINDRRG